MKKAILKFSVLMIGAIVPALAFAQIAAPPAEDAGLEDLYDKYETQEVQQSQARKKAERAEEKPPVKELSKISELVTLSPFEDVAVIQRRFLPKTHRFELSGAAAISTNNAFFNNVGIGARFGWYLTEKYGIEGTYMFLSSSERPITEGLKNKRSVQTTSLVEPESYMGAAFKWAPLYGKMAWLGKTIIPFDLYLSPGFGVTKTAQGESEPTISIGAGQLFAISKSSGVRWDFTWNFYSATTRYVESGTTISKNDNHNDLLLSIGYSFFFPEATYR
jgi:outer membrane beta-barrel protein